MKKFMAFGDTLKDKWFLVLLVLLCFAVYTPVFANDTYWILNAGRYISSKGLPTIDPFTMHVGLNVPIQQWLSDVIFYRIDSVLGQTGIFTLMFLVLFINCFVLYTCLLYTSPSPRDRTRSRMPSSA